MTRHEFDRLGIASQCWRPDPSACYERLTSYEQSEAEPCLHCPIASWVTAIVFSSRWTNESVSLEEKRIDKAVASIQEARLGAKAA